MQRTVLPGMILGLLLFCFAGVLLASEVDELRERAKALRKEALVMAERGHEEEAGRLKKEAVKLLEAAERIELRAKARGAEGDRPGIDNEARQLKERLQDLLAKERKMREAEAPEREIAEVREQISNTEGELRQMHARHAEPGEHHPEFRAQAEKLELASRRIHHMRVAAENLRIAELHDLAHQVMEKAGAMERDVQEGKQRLAAEMHEAHKHREAQIPDVVRELREEIERLRAEVKELSQRVEKR